MTPPLTLQDTATWTLETPSAPGWYWLRHAVFCDPAGMRHEVYCILVELTPADSGALMLCVTGSDGTSDGTRSLDELVAGEWVGPLTPPS